MLTSPNLGKPTNLHLFFYTSDDNETSLPSGKHHTIILVSTCRFVFIQPSHNCRNAEPQDTSAAKSSIPVEIFHAEDGTPMLPSVDDLDSMEKDVLVRVLTQFLSAAWSKYQL